MTSNRSIFDEPHHQSLELLAVQALANGDSLTAFKYADRRCRILPLAEPHCYVLRSEASFRIGAKKTAIADLTKALEIAPDDVAANRRMLAWARGPQQKEAALALIGRERNFEVLHKAIQVLWKHGQRNFANVSVFENAVEGWAVWQDDGPLHISISNGDDAVSEVCEPELLHPLGACGHATSFHLRRPRSGSPQSITLVASENVFHSVQTAGNESASHRRSYWTPPSNAGDHRVTIVVPIYADYNATRDCLESLLSEIEPSPHRAILVDDATPDPRIANYLAELGSKACVEILTNARNLGFVGSVNRAFERAGQDDIILLNADTIVPTGFINRLADAAQSSPDIGTVTPLSNNGEFVSFPIANQFNPLGSREEIDRIDKIAAKVNAGTTVDIPTGIGFCLYIKRTCLDAIAPLSESFAPGYLEDADFCLRAREAGFRNVCAPSVYVGHAGSKSFGPEKRSLVVRNLQVLEHRFPEHRMDCAIFMDADPLRSAREAIERAAVIRCQPNLLIAGVGAIGAVARERAHELVSKGAAVMIVEVGNEVDRAIVKIINVAGGMPQSLQFNFASVGECELLMDFFRRIEPLRIEFLDPINTPFELVDLLLTLKVPYDLFIADAGLLGAPTAHIPASGVQPFAPYDLEKRSGLLCNASGWTDRWRAIAAGAERIIAPSGQAEAFVATILPQRSVDKISQNHQNRSPVMRTQRPASACHLGFVTVRSCADEQRLISEIAGELGPLRPDISMTVIGTTRDDIGLMRTSGAFVTGAVDPKEFVPLIDTHGIGHLFVSTTQPLFVHPILSAVFSSHVPTAYFDWSMACNMPNNMDLAIDARSSLNDIVSALIRWMPKAHQSSGNVQGRNTSLGFGQALHAG